MQPCSATRQSKDAEAGILPVRETDIVSRLSCFLPQLPSIGVLLYYAKQLGIWYHDPILVRNLKRQ